MTDQTPESVILKQMSRSIRRLQDLEDIRTLKARYCEYCDGGWPAQSGTHAGPVAELFIEDGEWDARPGMPLAKGKAAIRNLFESCRISDFVMHFVSNPIIDIIGDTATGNWKLIGCGTVPGSTSGWFVGYYDESYVRTSQGWRFSRMRPVLTRKLELLHGWGGPLADGPWATEVNALR